MGERLDLSELGKAGAKLRIEMGGNWEEVFIKPVPDRMGLFEIAAQAQTETVGNLQQNTPFMSGLRGILEITCRQDPEGTARQAMDRASQRVVRDGKIVNRIDWEASQKFPPVVREGMPLPENPEQRADVERRNDEQAAKRDAWIATEQDKEYRRLVRLSPEERAAMLADDRIQAAALTAFFRSLEEQTLLACTFRANDEGEAGAAYFSNAAEIGRLPASVREQILTKHEELAGPEELPFASPATATSDSAI